MSPHCDLDLEDSNKNKNCTWHPYSWCFITIPSLVTKCSMVQKISFGHLSYLYRTLWLLMLYYQTKFGWKWTSSLEDIVKIVIFWLYKPSLWPWPQWTNFSEWQSSLRCCINTPGLVTKCSVVQKISSGQTFTDILNLCCDLDLKH